MTRRQLLVGRRSNVSESHGEEGGVGLKKGKVIENWFWHYFMFIIFTKDS